MAERSVEERRRIAGDAFGPGRSRPGGQHHYDVAADAAGLVLE